MPASFPDGEIDRAVELGAVDSCSVRIWVRQSDTPTIHAELFVDGQPFVSGDLALSAETDWTGALTLALPAAAPGAPFTCKVGTQQLTGRLAPAPNEHSGITFGFGSCHRPFLVEGDRVVLSPAAAIYPAMDQDLKQQRADFILLVGDQVYSDELAPISVRDHLSGDEQHPPPLNEALAAYRRVSRGFLGESGFRRLREDFPTYCIWDDHDVFNCWGSRLAKTPLDWRMFEGASRAYCEYQHTRNPGGAIATPPYNYSFRYGDIGFLVLDLRGARDYERGRLLGREQWEAIRTYLKGEDAATIQTLFVAASIPMAHVSRWMAVLFDKLPGKNGSAVRDRWCSAAFIDSRDELLDELLAWQAAGANRQVIVLSGDVHCASTFTIRPRKGGGLIQQWTSSALTTPDPLSQRTINRLAVKWPNAFEPKFSFQRRLLTFLNNYGLVSVEPLPAGGHRVTLTQRVWDPKAHQLNTAGQVVALPSST